MPRLTDCSVSILQPTLRKLLLVGLACSLVGCITINIYFPAAAAEKAADQVIDQIWQAGSGAAKPSNDQPNAPQTPASNAPLTDTLPTPNLPMSKEVQP